LEVCRIGRALVKADEAAEIQAAGHSDSGDALVRRLCLRR
jgi:hypothetical protein